ncbi:MAG: hypothetical protein IPL25_16925 [Saprospiraceae bacterium]|nr:hypothetical protein [Candidatus Vicinibacter affinis]
MRRDGTIHWLLTAKDEEGYKDLSKLCSLELHRRDLYGKFPRILDKELINFTIRDSSRPVVASGLKFRKPLSKENGGG